MQTQFVQSNQTSLFTHVQTSAVSAKPSMAMTKHNSTGSQLPMRAVNVSQNMGTSSQSQASFNQNPYTTARNGTVSMRMDSSASYGATGIQMRSSETMSGSKVVAGSSFTASNNTTSRLGRVSVKMSAAKNPSNNFEPTSFIQNSLRTMNLAGQGRVSQVVMQATKTDDAPVVTGNDINDHIKEGFQDMLFYHKQYETLANIPHYTGNQYVDELMATAKSLATPGKGILASDESTGTIGNRFSQIGVENTHKNRIAYRQLLFEAPEIEKYISGAILYDETARDKDSNGKQFVQGLAERGIIPGIKIDIGMSVIQGTKDETATMGLDGMNERAQEYYKMGIRFAKWRAVIKIDEATGCPSEQAIQETAHSLARYGSICQHAGLVPIIEPEILSDGSHSIQKCAEVSERVYNAVQSAIIQNHLIQEGLLWKPNMVTQGAECKDETSPEEVAFYTVRTLSRTIPPSVPGITFLSGGQPEETASQNLNAINKLAFPKHPWNMSFSFGRALQTSVLKEWKGQPEGVKAAQDALLERCKSNGMAALGKYEGGTGSTESDYVANYRY